MFIEKATRLPQHVSWSTVLRRTSCTQQLFARAVSQSLKPPLLWNGGCMKLKHLGTLTSALNNHRPLNRPLAQAVPEFNAPLRQFQHAKQGFEVLYTCTTSLCCMAHVESHGTHFHPPLDHTTSERSLKRTLPGKAPQFNSKLLPLRQPHHDRQDGAQIYQLRFAPEWCEVHENQLDTSP